jgi:hypothetical protein
VHSFVETYTAAGFGDAGSNVLALRIANSADAWAAESYINIEWM